MNPTRDVLVDVRNLQVHFPVTSGLLQRKVGVVKAVDDVSFSIKRGETVGLVGESGCGKTTLGRAILRLIDPTGGQIYFEGEDVTSLRGGELRRLRRKAQIIFQDPYSSLDPRQTAGNTIGEPLLIHGTTPARREYRSRVAELMEVVGLNANMADRFPHEFSGGQRQRIGVARALSVRPDFIVCDEPISALDVSIQAQIINLLVRLQSEFKLTYLFIAHDLSVVRHISDRIVVMYLGKVMEIADRDELYKNPLHPYTKALLSAVPVPDPDVEAGRQRLPIYGEIPSPLHPPSGCVFRTRCPQAIEACGAIVPEPREVESEHRAACIRVPGYGGDESGVASP
ncbi:MAG: ATP-binding cassette domain-containing protein [Chloroflexi bacterium]|nr:ATP-binding cassette domain-containing protein [Chloroflexota bacterium]